MAWDLEKALTHLRTHARPAYGVGKCATYVREAIEAGGLHVSRAGSGSGKDFGFRLVLIGFQPVPAGSAYQKGDVAVIDGFTKTTAEGIKKDHTDGHVAMYDGTQWISDFKQSGTSPYPGSDYSKASPKYVIYRNTADSR